MYRIAHKCTSIIRKFTHASEMKYQQSSNPCTPSATASESSISPARVYYASPARNCMLRSNSTTEYHVRSTCPDSHRREPNRGELNLVAAQVSKSQNHKIAHTLPLLSATELLDARSAQNRNKSKEKYTNNQNHGEIPQAGTAGNARLRAKGHEVTRRAAPTATSATSHPPLTNHCRNTVPTMRFSRSTCA